MDHLACPRLWAGTRGNRQGVGAERGGWVEDQDGNPPIFCQGLPLANPAKGRPEEIKMIQPVRGKLQGTEQGKGWRLALREQTENQEYTTPLDKVFTPARFTSKCHIDGTVTLEIGSVSYKYKRKFPT